MYMQLTGKLIGWSNNINDDVSYQIGMKLNYTLSRKKEKKSGRTLVFSALAAL